jgi:hypothetical protein
MKTSLPAAPWLPSQYEDEAAIITPDGYFLLNLEGLDVPDKEATARALRQAVAALPELVAALKNAANVLAALATGQLDKVERDSPALLSARAALVKAGAVPPTV